MRTFTTLTMVTATLAAAFGCSAPITSKGADLGSFDVDGPVLIEMTVTAIPYGRSDCSDLSPSFSMYWHGDEAQVELGVSVSSETYTEDTIADDGQLLTTIAGRWTRTDDDSCRLDAVITLTSEEPLLGTLSLSAMVGYGERSSAEEVRGSATVEPLD